MNFVLRRFERTEVTLRNSVIHKGQSTWRHEASSRPRPLLNDVQASGKVPYMEDQITAKFCHHRTTQNAFIQF